ncbi:hypothetical protein MN116_007601 [Schistosoma mekongi]|uniref:Uncharacterized protein n=1 Tax=Schistosoma mekongi TaxID=38744 RepID=A0AAE1Z7B6_SCHME|nr:hypothetical protein MN116_007601 [Schistosoma mekongi]
MAFDEPNSLVRKTSTRRSKPDMAALVDQQRFFETSWTRKPLFQLESLVPVVSLRDFGGDADCMELVDDTPTSVAENHFHKPSSTSFTSSNDPDLIENNTSSIVESDEDDDVPLSTFLPLKSDNLTNNTTIVTINHNNNNSNNNNDNHDVENLPILCPCTKPAILDDSRWDGQFCSPECLIRICHEAFDVWLTNHQSIIKNNSLI